MKKIVYIDGVFDLFHRGHLESIRKAKNVFNDPDNTYLIVGVVSDEDCKSYKRTPIINEIDRVELVSNIKGVDEVVFPCPMIMNLKFIDKHNIDIVVHGFSNQKDKDNQFVFFADIIKNNKFKEIEYYDKISTTQIINKIIGNNKL